MKMSRWQNVEMIFNEAVLLQAGDRYDFVVAATGSDEDLRMDILTLLDEADKTEDFLSEPVFNLGAQLLESEISILLDKPVFANYKLRKLLGRGGMGAVFLAEDMRLERLVALKIIPSKLSENDERIRRFQHEAKTASAISHPNIAHIYEFGKAEDRYFLAMEYVPGKTLRELLDAKPLDRAQAIAIAIQIANALGAAHNAGIVHRDIKPENIVMGADSVKILDFGLAKHSVDEKKNNSENVNNVIQTTPGLIIGTTAYMSPEQVRGKSLDQRTDLWSLGVCLYEMLTGKRPFEGETSSDVQAAILLKDPPPLKINDPKRGALQRILNRALSKDAEKRYQNATEFVVDLGALQLQRKNDSGAAKIVEQTQEIINKQISDAYFRRYLFFTSVMVFLMIIIVGVFLLLNKTQQ
jgi:eukaryotic-like serine/threonine-protein kinase